MELKHFVTLFSVGFIEGFILSALSDFAFQIFVSKSFTGYLSLFLVGVVLIIIFLLIPKVFVGELSLFSLRIMLVGIGFASFIRLLSILMFCTAVSSQGWGVFAFHQGPPYFSILGVPYTTILWSLLLGSLFTTLERVLKVVEDYRNEKLAK
jgi:hypothetical protein